MKMLRKFFFAAAVAGLALAAVPAQAAVVNMCSPDTASGTTARRVVNPNTNNAYGLNGFGCANIGAADVGYFLTQGFAVNAPFGSISTAAQIAPFTMSLPAGTYIRDIIVQETSGGVVPGGVRLGDTTAAATSNDIASGITLAANGLNVATDVSIAKRIFSATAPQTIQVGSVTSASFNGAQINVTIVYAWF